MSGDSGMNLDPRRFAFRADLADAALVGQVVAARFVTPSPASCRVPVAALRRAPEASAPRDTELLQGEKLRVFDATEGWAWVQSEADGYVGYVRACEIEMAAFVPTHRVRSRSVLVYGAASALAEPCRQLPLNATVAVTRSDGHFAELRCGGFVGCAHLAPVDAGFASDFVAVAEGFAGVPYLYGGRSAVGGIDCSGLVQMALAAAGVQAPRDSDMQAAEAGDPVAHDLHDLTGLRRGDLIFWPGHVAIMCSADDVIHASATTMCVAREPLATVAERSRKDGPLLGRVRRFSLPG